MRVRPLAFVALVVVLIQAVPAGAQTTTTTRPPPNPVSGRLLDGAGRPMAGAPVVLSENRGVANDVFGIFAFTFTLGLSCVAGMDPCRNSGSVRTDTDAAGRFRFDSAQVSKARGNSNGVVFVAGNKDKDGVVRVKFDPAAGGDLADVALWDPRLRVSDDDGGRRLQWSAPPSANSRTELHATIYEERAPSDGQRRVFVAPEGKGVQADVTIDPRGLEERPASLALSVGFSRPRANQNPRVDWVSRPVRVPGAGVPLSRGAACTITPGPPTQGCRLTDGDLFTPVPSPCPPPRFEEPPCPGAPRTATVDLGKPVKAGVVAVRGSVAEASVSADGVAWNALIRTSPRNLWAAQVFPADGPPWRYVRVSGTDAQLFGASEISVWPPGPLPLATGAELPTTTTPGATGGTGAARGAGATDDDDGHPAWLVALAIALLAAGCVVAGLTIGRARAARP